MVSNLYKEKVSSVVAEAKKRGLIKSYSDWCETKEAKDYALTKDETAYYISRKKGESK